jgi:tetratricopeptide (TPR) repeat protein
LSAQERWAEAEPYFQTILRLEPHNKEALAPYAQWLINEGRYQEVVNWLQGDLEQPAGPTTLGGWLAIALARQGRLAEALPYFEAALQQEPENGRWHFEYAVALRDTAQWAVAEEHFRRAVALNCETPRAHCEVARLLLKRQDYTGAQSHAQQARRLAPYDEQINIMSGKIAEEYSLFRRVEEELAYAVMLVKEGAVIEARQAFEQALVLGPNSLMVRREYSKFLQAQSDMKQAEEVMAGGLRIAPQDEEIKAFYISVVKAHASNLEDQRQLDQAINTLDQALQLVPGEPELEGYY